MQYSVQNGYEVTDASKYKWIRVAIDLRGPPPFWRTPQHGDRVAVDVPRGFPSEYVRDWIIRHADLRDRIDPGKVADYLPILTEGEPRDWTLAPSADEAEAFISFKSFPRSHPAPNTGSFFGRTRQNAFGGSPGAAAPLFIPFAEAPRIAEPGSVMGILNAVPRFKADGCNGRRALYIITEFAKTQERGVPALLPYTAGVLQYGGPGRAFIADDAVPCRLDYGVQNVTVRGQHANGVWKPRAPNYWELHTDRGLVAVIEFDFFGPVRYYIAGRSAASLQDLVNLIPSYR